jgi:hypothetical protein
MHSRTFARKSRVFALRKSLISRVIPRYSTKFHSEKIKVIADEQGRRKSANIFAFICPIFAMFCGLLRNSSRGRSAFAAAAGKGVFREMRGQKFSLNSYWEAYVVS